MSKPRSSRRTSARIATFHVDDEIEISSFRQRRESLRDLIRNVDLTEVPGSFANDQPNLPTFDSTPFEFATVGHSILSSRDRLTLQLIGAMFRRKEEELEDDVNFRDKS